jgi:galactose oxidase
MSQKFFHRLRRLLYVALFSLSIFGWVATPEAAAQTACAAIDTNSYYRITARHSNQSLDVAGGSQDNAAAIIQWPYGGGANQQWQFKASSGGYYTIVARHSQKNADVSSASQANGAGILQWPNSNGTNQQWCLRSVGNGVYSITARHSQKVMDVSGVSQQNGARVHQWQYGNGANQQWAIVPVGAIPTPPAANQKGRWSSKIDFPSIPVAAALLPNGKVMTWSSWDRQRFGNNENGQQKTYSVLFDPATNGITEKLITNTTHDMFCPGTAMLSDGRVLVNGGGPTVSTTSIYDFNSNQWIKDANMNQRRWYNTTIALPNGGSFTLGGNRTSGLDGRGELWGSGKGWRTLTGALMDPLYSSDPKNRSQEHPQLAVAPNGKLFAAGPTANMQWYDLGGNGSYQSAGTRGNDEFGQNGIYAMYDVGKILKAGGNPNYDGAQAESTPSSRSAYVIDINSSSPQVTQVQSMQYPRAFANSAILPDGKVMVVGGLNNGRAFSDNGAILTPEVFDPRTNSWSTWADMAIPRTYHSIALLLPDGRVLAGGGGLCSVDCNVNHSDVEIFSPPYLFQGNRPSINSAPGSVGYNRAFTVQASTNVTQFSLIRLSSVTHSVNTDQRFKRVTFQKNGGTYTLNLESNANITPPGYYMLFALNGQSVPSVSKIIKVGA